MKTVKIKGGFLSLAESKAKCIECGEVADFHVLEDKWNKAKNRHTMRHRCSCGNTMGIAVDMRGDFVSFNINKK